MSELMDYLKAAKSPYHVCDYAEKRLEAAGFDKLEITDGFELVPGGRYYCRPYPTVLFAFKTGEKITRGGMHIACAHTDSPTFRIKPSPEMGQRGGIKRVNVEPYGGSLKRTWFDRPLGVAGEVILKSGDPFAPKAVLFDSEQPWFIIPSLAPHMDREIEEKKLDVQKELIPVYEIEKDNKCDDSAPGDINKGVDDIRHDYVNTITGAIANKLGIDEGEILDYDLSLYLYEEPLLCGVNSEFLLSSRIDNVASVAALTEGLIGNTSNGVNAHGDNDISVIALFDNEEIGSRSKQGADSSVLNLLIDRIFESGLFKDISKTGAIASSSMLSVDGAHGVHPNYPEKADETARVFLGKGLVLKSSAAQRYVTDPYMGAVVAGICEENDIAFQRQANRSGAPGGQTLGPLVSSYLPIPAADLGVPMLAMHSAKETMCPSDYDALLHLSEIWLRV